MDELLLELWAKAYEMHKFDITNLPIDGFRKLVEESKKILRKLDDLEKPSGS